MESHHAHKNDLWAMHLFPNKTDGFFLEAGAMDGIRGSATLILERRGWQGICIEPVPGNYEKLRKNRKCFVSNACLSSSDGEIVDFIIPHVQKARSGILRMIPEWKVKKAGTYRTSERITKTLLTVFRELGIETREIDYVNLDTEGSETAILETAFRNGFNIKAISVEGTQSNKLLEANGFVQVNNPFVIKCCNCYFVHKG